MKHVPNYIRFSRELKHLLDKYNAKWYLPLCQNTLRVQFNGEHLPEQDRFRAEIHLASEDYVTDTRTVLAWIPHSFEVHNTVESGQ